ncbi:MAG TPA: hypothetical protein VK273_01015 [Gaiellaceae bacterium]|nr:hypothetical protein [Gaiellaceae bacterium]
MRLRCFIIAVAVAVALAALAAVPASGLASGNVLQVTPRTVNFGAKPVESSTIKFTTISNTSDEAVLLTLTLVRSWDDFAGGLVESTCTLFEPAVLAPGESCTLVERFVPHDEFIGIKQDQIWVATATDVNTGEVLDTEELVFFGRAR